jgi:hypothetical protein
MLGFVLGVIFGAPLGAFLISLVAVNGAWREPKRVRK